MNLGPLNRRIRIEQRSSTQDDYGRPSDTWTTYATLWATVEEMLPSRGERLAEGLNIASRPTKVRTRYVTGITSAMRVFYLDRSDRVMKIVSQPVELGNKLGLEFMVQDFTTAGQAV